MKELRIDPAAEAELVEALVRHDRLWRQWGRDLHAEFQAAFDAIRRTPAAFPPSGRRHRMYVLRKTPYVVYYRDLPSVVWIAAIAHTKRRPGYWLRRRPPTTFE